MPCSTASVTGRSGACGLLVMVLVACSAFVAASAEASPAVAGPQLLNITITYGSGAVWPHWRSGSPNGFEFQLQLLAPQVFVAFVVAADVTKMEIAQATLGVPVFTRVSLEPGPNPPEQMEYVWQSASTTDPSACAQSDQSFVIRLTGNTPESTTDYTITPMVSHCYSIKDTPIPYIDQLTASQGIVYPSFEDMPRGSKEFNIYQTSPSNVALSIVAGWQDSLGFVALTGNTSLPSVRTEGSIYASVVSPPIFVASDGDCSSGTSYKFQMRTIPWDPEGMLVGTTVFNFLSYACYQQVLAAASSTGGGGTNPDSDPLSTGAIVGIALGGAAGLAIVAWVSWHCCCRHKAGDNMRQPLVQHN